ncbi:hypothetical protein GCM10007920_22240 [Ciceribacter naphthalenivorans]|uniref:Uncharacterized protein n=2 Tax=Alphaproteobacteria TaxID=28211 RepID=A0A512HG89_9HYPH|nr:hypothetical protein RNA01_14060 [Ciceribacter naphthalenivorans]GLR22437.1 hypothetical protein GCM10007920_22240 [Ciceribacter naphthalenivorans]GLT05293.1 hypothetical protein GCM10007926_22240 [Sphingomonas psychrolutea]
MNYRNVSQLLRFSGTVFHCLEAPDVGTVKCGASALFVGRFAQSAVRVAGGRWLNLAHGTLARIAADFGLE